jgi:two-component system, chemotaxis family, sensor kinase CheA
VSPLCDRETLKEFLLVSNENLDRLETELHEAYRTLSNQTTLAGAYRTIHAIQATCALLGIVGLEETTHRGENLLTSLRDGRLEPNPAVASELLAMVNVFRKTLRRVEASGGQLG